MSAEIIPFDFEEQAVRVVMRGDEPWFVAADVCRVLEIGNPTQAVARLDEDEVTLCTTEGNHRETNIINESGLYSLIFTSRKPQAKRFRKWVTAEVLPALRRTGRYEMPGLEGHGAAADDDFAGMPARLAELWLQVVREARLSRGTAAAIRIWDASPLPGATPFAAVAPDPRDPGQGYACLRHIMDATGGLINAARCECDVLASQRLAQKGLRTRAEGLFVANFALAIFDGTEWQDGAHRAALMTIPGVQPYSGNLTLASQRTRGMIVPWAALETATREGNFAA